MVSTALEFISEAVFAWMGKRNWLKAEKYHVMIRKTNMGDCAHIKDQEDETE